MSTVSTALSVAGSGSSALQLAFAKAEHYLTHSKAAATLRAYRADWDDFQLWCREHGTVALPSTPATIALYIADRAETLKVATLNRRLAAISKAHQTAGYKSPCAMRHAPVAEVLAGVRRVKGTAAEAKAALLTADLRRIIGVLPNNLLGARDAALLLVGYAGGFRRAELAQITVSDFDFNRDGLIVTLQRSKTDQEGKGRKVGIPFGSDPAMCPVRRLQTWLECSRIKDGPVFRAVDRHGNVRSTAITDKVVALVVKRHCAVAGLNADTFAGHSLRAGLATQAAINGASERCIAQQTGHRSIAMVRRYVRDGQIFRDNAAARLGL